MKYARVEVDGTTRWGTVRDGAVQLLDGSPYDGGRPEGPELHTSKTCDFWPR